MQKQSIKAALKRAEYSFDSATFRATCEALGINENWGYRFSALKRTVEIQMAGHASAAHLCLHHGGEALAHAKHFYQNTVIPYPSTDYAGTKKLWGSFPLNLRTRLESIFSKADHFKGISEIEERFLLWENAYLCSFGAIQQIAAIDRKSKPNKEFHRVYVLAFEKHWPELESILNDLVSLDS